MSGFIEGEDRTQATLFPERIDDYITEENAVRVIDVFVDELDLSGSGFKTIPERTGRPAYHPASMLKLYIYGYLNRIQSSRRLEREAGRNVELMWLLGRLAPDFKTIADLRKNNGEAIRLVCREFVMLCRKLNLFSDALKSKTTRLEVKIAALKEEIQTLLPRHHFLRALALLPLQAEPSLICHTQGGCLNWGDRFPWSQ